MRFQFEAQLRESAEAVNIRSMMTQNYIHEGSIGPKILPLLNIDKTRRVRQFQTLHPPAESWTLAKYLWIETERLAADPNSGLKSQLSTAQFHSFTMLSEWIKSKFEIPAAVEWFHRSLYDRNTDNLIHEYRDNVSHIANEPFRQMSLYQNLMSDLFRIEFSPAHWAGEEEHNAPERNRFVEVGEARRLAWQVRTAQRIAWKFTLVDWNQGLDNSTNCTVFRNPPARMNYCPWLERELWQEGFPRYLWHIREKKTVETSLLENREEYTCISHTWGRWRMKEWARIPNVPWRVPLNSRFDIETLPDTFYSMRERFTTDYVWIDLFCMPQDPTDPILAKILTEEIARQAVIFQNASACVAWLNYVNHWVSEYCTIGWLSAKYIELSRKPGMCDVRAILGPAERSTVLPLQLTRLDPPTYGLSKWRAGFVQGRDRLHKWWRRKRQKFPFYHFEPSDWFSGVWTLQEAHLRRNMVLASRDWCVLSDAAGEPISLEELLSFVNMVFSLGTWGTQVLGRFLIEGHGLENCPVDEVMDIHYDDEFRKQAPPGPRQLAAMADKTHLFPRTVDSRIDPLIQANARFCTAGRAGRAEAIMCCLGITQWFRENSRAVSGELVLGMYPARFLREASAAIGPDFWTTSCDFSRSRWAVLSLFTGRTGSMMPFRPARETKNRMTSLTMRGTLPYPEPNALHSSVLKWEILKNGSVKIPEAVVLCSNRTGFSKLQSVAYLSFWGARFSESNDYVLSDWVECQPSVWDTFVVSLTEKRDDVVGILLQGRRFGRKSRLVRIGIFRLDLSLVESEAWPDAQAVDWLVV